MTTMRSGAAAISIVSMLRVFRARSERATELRIDISECFGQRAQLKFLDFAGGGFGQLLKDDFLR